MTQTIKSLTGFVQKISKTAPAGGEVLLYRGHSDRGSYKLIPSILREDVLRTNEHSILRELVASHPNEFTPDSTTFDRLVRVQHYSLPTRLLDVTLNPLVALFFASDYRADTSGEVIVFRVKKDSVKFFDSDTVSCIANLAHLKADEKAGIDFGLADIDEFNGQKPIDRLIQFIRAEKPHFRAKIIKDDLKKVVCVKPKKNNPRILAQSGVFLLFGLTDSLETNPVADISIDRIIINKNEKEKIRKELDRMAVNDSTLFPDIEKSAIYIRKNLTN